MAKWLLFIFIGIVYQSSAQTPITLTRADFPKPTTASSLPDSVLFTSFNSNTTTAQNINGANSVWDESQLSGNAVYQNFLSMSATPLVFQLLFFGCDYAEPLLNNSGLISGGTVSDAYMYYNYAGNDSRLEVKGFGANMSFNGSLAVPVPALYTSPDVLYRFPLTFGDVDSSQSGYNISIPIDSTISIGLKRNQVRVNTVDAWGRLTTPAGTFDVLRVESNIKRIDSVSTPLGTIGFPSNPMEYKWLGQGMKIPVLQLNAVATGANVNVTNGTFYGQGYALGLPSSDQGIRSLLMYPNPSENNPIISFDNVFREPVSIWVHDLNGKNYGEFHFAADGKMFKESLPLGYLSSGNYLIRVQSGTYQQVEIWSKK